MRWQRNPVFKFVSFFLDNYDEWHKSTIIEIILRIAMLYLKKEISYGI